MRRHAQIKSIGIFVIVLGAWALLSNAKSMMCIFLYSLYTIRHMDFSVIELVTFFRLVLAISLIMGGIAFLFLKEWSRGLVLISLAMSVLLHAAGIVRYWYSSLTAVQSPVIPEGWVMVATVSMIPQYLITLAEVLALHLISRPKIKKLFLQQMRIMQDIR